MSVNISFQFYGTHLPDPEPDSALAAIAASTMPDDVKTLVAANVKNGAGTAAVNTIRVDVEGRCAEDGDPGDSRFTTYTVEIHT